MDNKKTKAEEMRTNRWPESYMDMAKLFASLVNDSFRMMYAMKSSYEWGDTSQAEYNYHQFKEYWEDTINDLNMKEYVNLIGYGDIPIA